jgi:outer membrane murein-binding lipoprotein Lpp/YHS domain-containing protein
MKHTTLFAVVVTTGFVGLSGCGSQTQTSPASSNSSAHANHNHNYSGDDLEKMKAELAKLSPEDAASAEKQHLCPVSGEMLGTMGAPIKVDVNGQQVWICCDGCKKALLENPDEHLAKLRQE